MYGVPGPFQIWFLLFPGHVERPPTLSQSCVEAMRIVAVNGMWEEVLCVLPARRQFSASGRLHRTGSDVIWQREPASLGRQVEGSCCRGNLVLVGLYKSKTEALIRLGPWDSEICL